jgi:glycosyltransferase involved in cell wall biosynthesis
MKINVSVIIPVFNRHRLIKDALLSVKKQTYEPYEIIVIDDYSTDSTVSSVSKCKSDLQLPIKVLKNNRKKGVSGALNTGIFAALGQFIAILDSDDLWESTHLEQLIYAFKKYPDAKIGFSKIEVFGTARDKDEKQKAFEVSIGRCLKDAFFKKEGNIWLSNTKLLSNLFNYGVPFRCQASLIERQFFMDTSLIFNENISYTQDAQFVTLAAHSTAFLYIDNVGLYLRRHNENDGDIGYADNIYKSYETRILELKQYFKNKKIRADERITLKKCLWRLQTHIMIAKSLNGTFGSRLKQAIMLFFIVPGLASVKSSIKYIFLGK